MPICYNAASLLNDMYLWPVFLALMCWMLCSGWISVRQPIPPSEWGTCPAGKYFYIQLLLLFAYTKKPDQGVSSRLCLPPKATLHLAADVIKQLSAPFPLPQLPGERFFCSSGPREIACASLGAEAAQRAARAGVNTGMKKWDFSFPWQQAARSAQATNIIIPTTLSKEGLYPASTLPQENCSVLN